MKAMLAFLSKHRSSPHIVLIDDISRLARGVKAHIELRAAISLAGGVLESPSVEFGDDADSELQEFILATVAQHQRRKNAEQVRNRMRARILNGYWPFPKPIGYRYEKRPGHGRVLVRDEPFASIITEALEGFASGRFQIQAEVQRFFESQPCFPRTRDGEVRAQQVTDILTRPIYAGYIEAPKWDITLRKGQHEPLICYETYQKIQARLTGSPIAPARENLGLDFALRGFVVCGDCGSALYSCWSSGRKGARYPYYLCQKRDCPSYGKSTRRERLEADFEELLRRLEPNPLLLRAARAMFKDLWEEQHAQAASLAAGWQGELSSVQKQIDQLLDRIATTETLSVVAAYEKRITELELLKVDYAARIANCGGPARDFDTASRNAMEIMGFWGEGLPENGAQTRVFVAPRLPQKSGL